MTDRQTEHCECAPDWAGCFRQDCPRMARYNAAFQEMVRRSFDALGDPAKGVGSADR